MTESSQNSLQVPDEVLMNKIYLIRGEKVMLDRDLAVLFGVKPIRLREQVKRNKGKFPGHFMFRLNDDEVGKLVSQNAIPSVKHLGGTLPYVFTEYGLLQLANILRSERATLMSIRIIEVFVAMRKMLHTHQNLLLKMEQLEKRLTDQDGKVKLLFDYLRQFIKEREEPRTRVGFKV
ncbi:MAG: ORF6N domain-containing protein [Flavobacteriales bacterium]|nr:ORF6N domain-containing protein [Flavobacteriales bacterium]